MNVHARLYVHAYSFVYVWVYLCASCIRYVVC